MTYRAVKKKKNSYVLC